VLKHLRADDCVEGTVGIGKLSSIACNALDSRLVDFRPSEIEGNHTGESGEQQSGKVPLARTHVEYFFAALGQQPEEAVGALLLALLAAIIVEVELVASVHGPVG
jgi:hypothetical protein